MSRKTVKEAVLHALQDLKKEKFEEFRHELVDTEEKPHIRFYEVEDKSRLQIAELLISRWADEAPSRTGQILTNIGCIKEAQRLAIECEQTPKRDRSRTPPPQFSSAGGASAAVAQTGAASYATASYATASYATAQREHFVDRHRDALVSRVSNISPILDHLLQKKVLQQEQYDMAMDKGTTQAQMRFLFSGPLKSGGKRAKDELLSALETEEPFLIEDLREREG